jgi:tRNA threonylcarbamoyladenosine dehydratase
MTDFSREVLLLGNEAMGTLAAAHVAVFGLGGVGGACAEALARAGVGRLTIVDNDVVSLSNLNRQVIALHSTIGQRKTDVMRGRILDINPAAIVTAKNMFYSRETAESIDLGEYSVIIDAIDTVSSKLLLICQAKESGTDIISCMGTGNKLDASRFEFADIADTSVCPLARVLRKELGKRGITQVRVLYSKETPLPILTRLSENGRHPPGSVSFVPPVAGMLLAGEAIRMILHLPR